MHGIRIKLSVAALLSSAWRSSWPRSLLVVYLLVWLGASRSEEEGNEIRRTGEVFASAQHMQDEESMDF